MNLYEYGLSDPVLFLDPLGTDVYIDERVQDGILPPHRRITVDTWGPNGKGRYSLSFGTSRRTNCGASGDGSGSSDDDKKYPNGRDGGVYRDNGRNGTDVFKEKRRIRTTPAQDKAILDHWQHLDGTTGDYNLFNYNCRDFCDDLFADPMSDPIGDRNTQQEREREERRKWEKWRREWRGPLW